MIRTFGLGAGLLIAAAAHAQTVTWTFTLTGLEEVPPVITTGSAQAVVELNTLTNDLMWHLIVADLQGDFRAAHFHQAPVGVNGPVIIDITSSWMPDPGTARHGHMIGATVVTDPIKAALLAGNVYINIHTTLHPGGEIRGQVVPAAGSLPLLTLGGWIALRRRR
jgi:hypothetical protein